jgi:hypothetical protein
VLDQSALPWQQRATEAINLFRLQACMHEVSAQLAFRVCTCCQQRLQLVIYAAALSHAAIDVLPLCFVLLHDLAARLSILDFTLHSAAVIFQIYQAWSHDWQHCPFTHPNDKVKQGFFLSKIC